MKEDFIKSSGDKEFVEINPPSLRKVIGRRMLESKQTIPHFYLFDEINMKNAVELRKELNEKRESRISFNDMIIRGSAIVLNAHPECNASFAEGKILRYSHVHINIAVAVEGGLLVPTLKYCEQKSLYAISDEAKILAEKARNKKLRPHEGIGGTFTISNLGMYGLEGSFSIINPPQSLILTVGAIREVPVIENGQLKAGIRMKATLSCDHRVLDGAVGAVFLTEVKKVLENPQDHLL
jgi:pyruvate dehydrogenase E2 component (dihydrolipoamide acetyltransferase)